MSVVIPLYNHAAYVEQAVNSVLAQGPIVRELIVLDDGSGDDSAAVMARLARRDPRIRFERQANAGAHAALNTALGWCQGEFLAILNSDDSFVAGRLVALAAVLDNDPGADIAASAVQFMDGNSRIVGNEWYEAARVAHTDLGVGLLNGNHLMSTSNLMFRRDALHGVGAFAALRYAHDLDWVLRALALGRRVALAPGRLLTYRMHDSNTISEDHGRVRAEWAMAAAAYLTTLWDRRNAPPIDYNHAAAAAAVLRTHQLDRAVAPCMAYLRRNGAVPLDRSALLADAPFRARVADWV